MRKLIWGGVALTVAASMVLLASARSTQADRPSGSDTVRVARRDIEALVKATGVVKPRVGAEVRVGSRISGVVKRLYVRIGDTITKGQVLAQLDERDLAARRDEADAALQQAEVTLRYARIELERKRALFASGSIAQNDLDAAEQASAVAEKRVGAVRATLAYAATQLDYARIVAPIGGVVASVSTQEGETVAASFSAPTFLTLLDPSRLEVWAYVDETDIGRIRLGQKAQFTLDTYGSYAFDGRVTAVYPKAEIRDNVVNYVAVVTFTSPRDRTVRPEMTAAVRIELDARQGALVIPIRAIRREGDRAVVLLLRGGTVERREVITGMKDERYVEILGGLNEGDAILVGDNPAQRSRDS